MLPFDLVSLKNTNKSTLRRTAQSSFLHLHIQSKRVWLQLAQSTELPFPDTALFFFHKPMIFSDAIFQQPITNTYAVSSECPENDHHRWFCINKFSQRKCCSLFQDPSFSNSPVTLAHPVPQYRSARILQNRHDLLWPTQFHLEKVHPHSGTTQRGKRDIEK